MNPLERIPARWRTTSLVAAIVVAYVVALRLPGVGDMLHRRMPPAVIVIGVITGAVTALLAIGLILVYRANRFINFAYGAMGSLVGVLAIGMHIRHGWPYFVVLPLGVAGGIALGALLDLAVIRRFSNSSRLLVTVASIGLAQLLGGLELIGSKAINFISLTGGFRVPISFTFDIGVKTLSGDEILVVAVIPVVIAGLAWFLLRTDAGVAVRASAENADRALLLGIPVRRLATIVWMVAGGLAALTYILKAPFSGVTPGIANGPTVLLPGLAAAVVARMESLPVAFAAGLGLGIAEQTVRWNASGTPSFVNVAYLIVIIVALLLQRERMSRAVAGAASTWSAVGVVKPVPTELRHLPEVRWPKVALLVVVAALALWVPSTWQSSSQLLAAFAIVWAIVAVSLVVLTGWGGHISLGQFALVGVGAIVAGNLISKTHTDLFLALLAAGAAGALAALLVGLPALRIRGLFLAVTTLAFAIALDAYFFNPDRFGRFLPTSVDRPVLWQRVDLESNYAMYVLCLAFLGLAILVASGVRKARSGRVLIATRDNERAADASAVPTTNVKLSAFVLAGAIAGVAGGLHVQIAHSLAQGSYNPVDSITVFSTAIIGGLGSVGGAIIGVLLFRWLETITALGDLRLLITGTGLLVVLYAVPGGIGQVLLGIRDRYLRWVAGRREILVPSLVADRRDVDEIAAAVETERIHAAADDIPALLSCRDVDVSYGPVQVLFGVDFRVTDGEIVALLGTNGAGKSTLLRAICGLTKPSQGRVEFDHGDITSLAADATTHRGVSLMPGGKGVFPTLTVDENLRLAAWLIRRDRAEVERAREQVLALFPILRQRRDQMAGDLSGGEQQMLALAGALMTRPRVLMIDELSLGLAPTIVAQLLDVVREIHRRGTTIVLVEQSVNVALELADRAVFMEKGEVRFEGPTEALLDRPDILRSVFIAGASAAEGGPPTLTRRRAAARHEIGERVVLECRGVTKRFGGITAVDDVTLSLRDGEIVGLIGHNGAGKTTLVDCLSGFLPLDGGRIVLRGVDVTDWLPHERARGGLGRSFQDALLYPTLTVAETIAVARERHLASKAMLAAALQLPASFESEIETFAVVEELIELMGLGAFRDKLTGELSTGSRRIVDLACILAQDPHVLLLDEPSGGVAQRETEALGPLLHRVREHTGCSMVVIEHDMPLLQAVCDRMIALELGGVIAEGSPADVLEHPRVIESYLGTDEATINRSGTRGRREPAVAGVAATTEPAPTGSPTATDA